MAEDRFVPGPSGEVEFDGAAPDDVELERYVDVTYRFDPDEFEPPDGHSYVGEGLALVEDGTDLAAADLNGEIELVEGFDREILAFVEAEPEDGREVDHAYLRPSDVVRVAGEESIGEVSTDRRKAHAIYTLIKEHEQDLFVAPPDGEVFWYDEGVWHGDPVGEKRLSKLGVDALGDRFGGSVLDEIAERIRVLDDVDRDEMGVPDTTVATPDGLLHLGLRHMRPLRPSDYALNRIQVSPSDDLDVDDSRFTEFIQEAVPDPFERAKLQEYAGYTLLPEQPFKKAAFLVGPTDSGKGTFLKALTAVLGNENVSNQSLVNLIETRWGLDKIYGKMANIRNEVTGKGVSNTQLFKELTGGGDTVTAEKKGQPTYEFKVTQKFLFATNQFPKVKDADDAFFNRLLFVEFPETVPAEEQDPELLDELQGEAHVILEWMLDGLEHLLDQGQFTGERTIDDKRAVARSFGSPIDQFVYEALDVTGDASDRVHKKGLYEAFTRFCDYEDADDTPVQATFTKRLKAQSGVGDSKSRPVGDILQERFPDQGMPDRPEVFTGIRIDEQFLKEIQAEIPAAVTSDDDVDRDGDGSDDRQSTL